MTIKLIIGLRNPGSAYEHTRHNAGAWFVEMLAQQHRIAFQIEKKMQGMIASIETTNQNCRLLLPLTFMNLSGSPALALAQFYRIAPEEILVVHDELDLAPGRIKLKTGGGHGGHNGLRDISNRIGTTFHRLRIGIGHPGHKDMVHSYVLGKPSGQDRELILEAIARGIDNTPRILNGDINGAMNLINV